MADRGQDVESIDAFCCASLPAVIVRFWPAHFVDLIDHEDQQHRGDADHDLDEADAALEAIRSLTHEFFPIWAVITCWCRSGSPGICQ
jgi:hypothetical protein